MPGMPGMPGMSGMPGFPGGIPQIPEKFMKGQIAKLAEEIVKELRVEDFGIDPAAMEAAGNDPTKALNMIMEVFAKNPHAFQNTVQKLGKKLALKIQSGAIRPQELVAEAEELMKTFSENPQFVEMMEAFRQAFGFEDKEAAQAAGRENENRLSIARNRLRKKLDAKKTAASAPVLANANAAAAAAAALQEVQDNINEYDSILQGGNKKVQGQGKGKGKK